MFGSHELQPPAALQQKLNSGSDKLGGGKIASVLLWAQSQPWWCHLVSVRHWLVHCCTFPTTQDWMFGGATLVRNGACMGVPLIAIGVSGGRFVIKKWAHGWFQLSKYLACCYWLLLSCYCRFVAPSIIKISWALLLAIGTGVHFKAL
ncbi:hypothetical protein O9992_22110 [Vibrio lentus]|nr:hypothetical protein [Vibrio lentus]